MSDTIWLRQFEYSAVEKLAEEEDRRADLPDQSAALNFELDDLLPLVDAGEMLGFVLLEDGSLELTPLGQTYAEASILGTQGTDRRVNSSSTID